MSPDVYLRRARDLAENARGRTAPNPPVGCVIVRDGQVVGEGWHAGPGQPHAERVALAAAAGRARGATLYCTLEPCCHHGRTPPCAEAIIAAGVARVVYAVDDPDPRVAGGGARRLREAGIEVLAGALREEIEPQLADYLHHRRTGRPYVIAKWAMTLDGKLATGSGHSAWISSPAARARVHRWRDQVDAVMIGVGTALADEPSLTCRLAEFETPRRPTRHPLRVVVDSRARLPRTARLLTDGAAPTLWATCAEVSAPAGVEVLRLPAREGRVELPALLDELGRRGLLAVLVEGGGELLGGLFRERLVQEVRAFIAPKLIGGSGPTPWTGPGVETMADALALTGVELERVGPDALLTGRIERD